MTDEQKNDAMSEGMGGSSSPTSAPLKSPKRPATLPMWRVLLHNDDVNIVEDVVKVLRQMTPLSNEDVIARVREAHHTGVALLLVTHQERAELYVDQLTSCRLTVTMEPDA